MPAKRKEIAVDPALYDQYVGEYELAPDFMIVITKENNKLMGQATGQPKAELLRKGIRIWFSAVQDELASLP